MEKRIEQAEAEDMVRIAFSLPVYIGEVPQRAKNALKGYVAWCIAHDGVAPSKIIEAISLLEEF